MRQAITTQPTQVTNNFPQPQPTIDPLVAFLLYFSVLLPLINQNLQHLLQLLSTLQKLYNISKRDRSPKSKKAKRDRSHPDKKPKQ